MFSEYYLLQVLTDFGIETIFEAEVFEISQSGTYIKVWKIVSLANIVKKSSICLSVLW